MPGSVLTVHVKVSDAIDQGDSIVTLAAMKMEHAVTAPIPGTIAEISVTQGDQVSRGQVLAIVEPSADETGV